jgi:hypothetical protein
MSFLFKSSKKGSQGTNALPPASRDIRSAEGPQSQIPTFNGAPNGAKPGSPTPGASASGSLNSLASEKLGGMRSPPPMEARSAPADVARGQVIPSSDQRVRNMSQDEVCEHPSSEMGRLEHHTDTSQHRPHDSDRCKVEHRLQKRRSRTPPHTRGRSAN